MKNASAMLQQYQASFSQRDPTPIAQQKSLPVFHLQLPHMAAEQRLSYPQRHSGSAEAAQLGNADKRFNLLQIHGRPRGVDAGDCKRERF